MLILKVANIFFSEYPKGICGVNCLGQRGRTLSHCDTVLKAVGVSHE